MFASAVLLAATQLNPVVVPFGRAPRVVEQPIAPIQTAGPLWASRCKDWDDWAKPAPPVRIHANTYLVGTCGISSILITGSDGDILIDGGPQEAADLVADNIRALGVRLQDIRYILTSHEHFDHAGAIANLQELSGATVITSAPAARVIASGTPAADDPQAGVLKSFPAAKVGRVVGDGDEVRLGNLMLTAMTTPGHTPGALSWRWVSCDGGVCRTIVYADSLHAVSNDSYRFSDHPAYVAAFRASIAKIAASPCEILLTPHPSASDMPKRLAAGKPLLDPDACRDYAAQLTRDLNDRLAKEAAARPARKP
jgi:metallo-beta-lactamase class B